MGEPAAFTAELKFVVDETTAGAVKAWLRPELPADPHSVEGDGDGYRTSSLYFDTPNFDLYNRRGSTGRAKFRIRRYNSGPIVFLERKQKVDGRLHKRRSDLPVELLERITSGASDEDWPGRWFSRRLRNRNLQPVCQIDYQRTARVGMSVGGPVRATIDSKVAAQPIGAIGFSDAPGLEIVPGEAIIELKFRDSLPPLFERLIAEFDLKVRPFSKYRAAAQALGFPLNEAISVASG
jgi:hypothetical protein